MWGVNRNRKDIACLQEEITMLKNAFGHSSFIFYLFCFIFNFVKKRKWSLFLDDLQMNKLNTKSFFNVAFTSKIPEFRSMNF